MIPEPPELLSPDYSALITALHVDIPCPQLFMYFASGAYEPDRLIQRLDRTERKHWSEENTSIVNILANKPEESIPACASLLNDPVAKTRIQAASALYALAHYSWNGGENPVVHTCLSAIETHLQTETEPFVRSTFIAYLGFS